MGRAAHLLYTVGFGLAGWASLLLASHVEGFAPSPPRPAELGPFLLFFGVIAATRALAFRVLPETLVSLDSAFYVAATVCLGSETAGRLVALALTLDALLRLLGADASGRREKDNLAESLGYVVYYGGMTGGLLMAVGWLFRVDERGLGRDGPEGETALVVVAAGATLLLLHYLIQGVRLWLGGTPPRVYLRRMGLPGIAAEASLLPLSVVVALIYDPKRPLGFALLGVTYLLINFVFNRLALATGSLRSRVSELETLNRSARALGSTLRIDTLLEVTARETLAALPSADLVAVAMLEEPAPGRSEAGFVVDCFDRQRGAFARVRARGEGPSARVVATGASLLVDDLRREGAGAGDTGIRAWLGVPIMIGEAVAGVLSAQSREPGVFGAEERRVLEAMGAQAGTALANARLYELATIDGLTGLFVRRYFDARLAEELERARRYGTEFSVLMLDVDDFKKLNDTRGHDAGDRVLREVAMALKRNMRGVDTAARFGGEEFACILPRTNALDAAGVAERVRQDIAGMRVAVGGAVLSVTVSLGVASYPDSDAESAEALVKAADEALYRAKQAGKNRVEVG